MKIFLGKQWLVKKISKTTGALLLVSATLVILSVEKSHAADECSILYYENVPISMVRMMKRDGRLIGPSEVNLNKEKDNWNKPCLVKVTLATADGTEIESIGDINCMGSKGEEWCRFATQKGTTVFSKAGKFKLSFYQQSSGNLLLEQPFDVIQWDKNYLAVKGDWENLAAFMIKNDGNVKFRFYLTTNSKAEAEKMEDAVKKINYELKIVLKYQGKPVANGMLKEDFRFEGTEAFDVDMSFEPAAGILKPLMADFFKGKDGEWLAAVFMGNQVLRKYPFKVANGEIVPHPRQSQDFAAKSRIINSLWPLTEKNGKAVDHFIWLEHSAK